MTKEYYQKNRLTILTKEKQRHERNKQSVNYRELTNTRKYLWVLNERVDEYQRRIKNIKAKISRVKKAIEILELKWGAERALCKKMKNGSLNQEQQAQSK
jgi:hypothetical protein